MKKDFTFNEVKTDEGLVASFYCDYFLNAVNEVCLLVRFPFIKKGKIKIKQNF